jgi:hypothetical protein
MLTFKKKTAKKKVIIGIVWLIVTSKFIFIDFACPTCRYPLGSGGNLVLTYKVSEFNAQINKETCCFITFDPLNAECFSSNAALFIADSKSLAPRTERFSFT